jgi:hypothetical protein
MNAILITELTVRLQPCKRRDVAEEGIPYFGYDILWPDGRPVRVGLRRFCRVGARLLLGRDHGQEAQLIQLTLHPVAGLQAPLTRPVRGVRCRRFYALPQREEIAVYFLIGVPTDVVFDRMRDEPEVLRWLQAERMLPGEPFWFDLACQTIDTFDEPLT